MEEVYPDDSLLARQIRAGSAEAFTLLYKKYRGYLYHFSLRFLRSRELAEETVHDVFLKIWENRQTLNPSLSLKGFLIKTCKNHVINQMNRAVREQLWKSELLLAMPGGHSDTENAVLFADYERLAEEAITKLPPQRQKIFRLYRLEEKSLDEIAEMEGVSKGTVKDHLLRATRQLKHFLKQYSGISTEQFVLIVLLSGHLLSGMFF